jgi:hypothetical protein
LPRCDSTTCAAVSAERRDNIRVTYIVTKKICVFYGA